ncbi:hypothetical protein TNCV_1439491 [Trichonephila clavipes]|nr:hypothetical protein TNCV_1439491 [Trichonephila clavipes]
MDWQTCSKILCVSRIVTAAMDIHASKSISELTDVSIIHVPSSSDAPERTFDDSVVALFVIFSHTTEQQYIHFHWLGCRLNGYRSTRRSYNDSCPSHAAHVWNKGTTCSDLAGLRSVPIIAFRP